MNYKKEKKKKSEKENEQQLLDSVLKKITEYTQYTSTDRQVIDEISNTYIGREDSNTRTPYKNSETIPKLRTEVNFIKPFIFSGDPEFEVVGQEDNDKTLAYIIEKILNWRLTHIEDYYNKIEDWVHQAVVFGFSIIRPNWNFQTKENQDGTETPIIDEPTLEVPEILDIFYNPNVSSVKEQYCLVFRLILNLENVKKNKMYNYTNELGKLNRDELKAKNKNTKTGYNSTYSIAQNNSSNVIGDGLIEIVESVSRDRIITIARGEKDLVLRDSKNYDGVINAVKFVFEKKPFPNRFDGFGVGHNVKGLGTLFYRLLNQSLDNVILANNPMFIFRRGANVNKSQLVAKPGGGIAVDLDKGSLDDNIRPIMFPDLKQGIIELMNKVDDEHKRASGASDLIQGSTSNKTLGQDEIAQSNVSRRFDLIVRRFKKSFAELGKMLLDMELKRLQSVDSDILKIFPEESREDIYLLLVNEANKVKWDITVKGETNVTQDKNLQSRRLIDLLNLSADILTNKEKRALLRRIAERQGEQNIDDIIAESDPIMEEQERMQAQQESLDPQMLPTPGSNQL